jgi:hypothetical protein
MVNDLFALDIRYVDISLMASEATRREALLKILG